MFEQEEPTLDLNNSTTLARDVIGDVVVEMSRLPEGDLILDVTVQGEVVRVERYRDASDFRAGCIFEHEVVEYRKLVK